MKKLLFILTLSVITSLTVNAQATKEDEQLIKNQCYRIGKNFGLNEKEIKEFTICYESKFNDAISNIPNVASSSKRIQQISSQIIENCLSKFQIKLIWNTETETRLKNYLLKQKDFEGLATGEKDKVIDCIVAKLKTKYPTGMPPDMGNENAIFIIECIKATIKP